MDCSSPPPYPVLDDSDEPLAPVRSPSRLDFCMGDLEEDDHGMEWSCTVFRGDFPYTFIDEDILAVDIAPHDQSCLLNVDGGEDDPPQASGSHADEQTEAPPMFFAPPDPVDQVVIEPRSPIPVRPPSVQTHTEAQESQPPSRITPQRLNYPHHGLSRSALLQQKTFWNSRHEEWVEWQSRTEQGEVQWQEPKTNDAYTGLAIAQPRAIVSPPPYMRTPPSGLERDLANHPARGAEQGIHASIYPRVGDISALRDPYSVNMDRSFFRLPLWTLHKMLYSFDMQRRIGLFSPPTPAYNATNAEASTSSSTLSSYGSTSEDEESDATLVGDSPVPKDQPLPNPLKIASPPHSPPSWDSLCGWESWYSRWQLLVGIFQYDPTKYDASYIQTTLEEPFEPKAVPSSPPRRIFHFTVGDEDDDDDEDYGTPIADSSFSVDFNEECERALAFYNREMK